MCGATRYVICREAARYYQECRADTGVGSDDMHGTGSRINASRLASEPEGNLEKGLGSLEDSCKMWEQALLRAIEADDMDTVPRLRAVLKNAYATLEEFNCSFGDEVNESRLSRLGGNRNHQGHHDAFHEHQAYPDDGASDASFCSADTSFIASEQDLTGFDEPVVASTPARSGSTPTFSIGSPIPSSLANVFSLSSHTSTDTKPKPTPTPGAAVAVSMYQEGLQLAREGKISVRKNRESVWPEPNMYPHDAPQPNALLHVATPLTSYWHMVRQSSSDWHGTCCQVCFNRNSLPLRLSVFLFLFLVFWRFLSDLDMSANSLTPHPLYLSFVYVHAITKRDEADGTGVLRAVSRCRLLPAQSV